MMTKYEKLSPQAESTLAELTKQLKTIHQCNTAVRAIHERWRELSWRAAREAQMKFSVGDRVEWDSKRFPFHMAGVITKMMDKNIRVKADDGLEWRVHPTILRKESVDGSRGKSQVR